MSSRHTSVHDYITRLEHQNNALLRWVSHERWTVEQTTMSLLLIQTVLCMDRSSGARSSELLTWSEATVRPLVRRLLQYAPMSSRAAFWRNLAASVLQQATNTVRAGSPRWQTPWFHEVIDIPAPSLKLLSPEGTPDRPIETRAKALAAFLSAQHWTVYEILCVSTMVQSMMMDQADPEATSDVTDPLLDVTDFLTEHPSQLGCFLMTLLSMAGEAWVEKPHQQPLIWEENTEQATYQPFSTHYLNPLQLPEAPATLPYAAQWNKTIAQILDAIHQHNTHDALNHLPRVLAISHSWPATTPYHALTQALAIFTTLLEDNTPFPQTQWTQLEGTLLAVDPPAPLDALTNIVLHLIAVLRDQDRLIDTLPVLRTWLYTMERIHGRTHPDTLLALHELAESLTDLYQVDDAYALTHDLLERRRETYGPTHEDTLRTTNNLGSQATHLGRFDEAERLLLTVLAHTESRADLLALRAAARDNLASVYAGQEQWERAIAHYEQLLDETAHLTGPAARIRIPCLSNLGNAYMSLNQFDHAAPFLEQAYALTRAPEIVGTHDGILVAIHWAITLQTLSRHTEATPILEAVVPLAQRVLGPTHPESLHAQLYLAANYESRNQTAEAERRLQEILTIADRDPDRLKSILRLTLHFIINLYDYHGRDHEAAPFHRKLEELS